MFRTFRRQCFKSRGRSAHTSAMQAIVVKQFGGPEVLTVETVPIPKPGPKDVLVKVMSTGVNPVDTYRRTGVYAAYVPFVFIYKPFRNSPTLPWIPGTDAAGVVDKIGDEVHAVKVGDRVWLHGAVNAYAQYCVVPETNAHILPDSVSFDQGFVYLCQT